MVVVDAHSKWLEVFPMTSTTTEKTLEVLRNLFAAYGLPEQLVSDNGSQFPAAEFEECMKANGIKHIKSSHYHPSTNGEAERFVQTFKHALKMGRSDKGSLQQKLAKFLLTYRSTPNATTGVSPAELFLKHSLRTKLDLLRPSLRSQVESKQADQKYYHDLHSREREFEVGQTVSVRNLRGQPKWLEGTIIEKTGPVSYKVTVGDQVWRRHADQLLDREFDLTITEDTDNVTTVPEPWSMPDTGVASRHTTDGDDVGLSNSGTCEGDSSQTTVVQPSVSRKSQDECTCSQNYSLPC